MSFMLASICTRSTPALANDVRELEADAKGKRSDCDAAESSMCNRALPILRRLRTMIMMITANQAA